MKKTILTLAIALVCCISAMAQDIWGNRYANSNIISDKADGMTRSIIATTTTDASIYLEMVFNPSDTTFYLHFFDYHPDAPIHRGSRMLFKTKNEILEIKAYTDSEIVSDTTIVNRAHGFSGQPIRKKGDWVCAHYIIPSPMLHRLMQSDISKVRMENDLNFVDFRMGNYSKKFQKMYEAIMEETRARSGDLREGL